MRKVRDLEVYGEWEWKWKWGRRVTWREFGVQLENLMSASATMDIKPENCLDNGEIRILSL